MTEVSPPRFLRTNRGGNLIGGYGPYRNTGNFDIATPAKALFDTLYLSARRGRKLRHFPDLTFPKSFSRSELKGWIAKIDELSLRVAVTERWGAASGKSALRSS